MKRLPLSVISLVLISASVAGCAVNQTVIDDRNETTAEVTEETTIVITPDLVNKPGNGPSYYPLVVDFQTGDRVRIFPNTVAYIEDRYVPELNQYVYSFIDINGNIICGGIFDKVSYDEGTDSYIVRGTRDGVSKYGIISADGAVFTGLIFDGISSKYSYSGETGFYGTNYENDTLWVTEIGADYTMSDAVAVTIDADALEVDPATSELTVSYFDGSNAVLYNAKEFYYNIWLINAEDGKILYQSNLMEMTYGKVFGNVIIEQPASGDDAVVYDMKGNKIIDGNNYSGRLTIDTYMIASDGVVNIYDTGWNVINSMEVPNNAVVMTSFERICVVTADKTVVYDKDLKEINTLDYPIYDGTYFRDWYGYGEGDFFYDSIAGTHEVINVSNGAKLAKEDTFYYSFKYGFIAADNISNGNDPVKKWRIYDSGMNLITNGEGRLNFTRDDKTGDVYALVITDENVIVYSMDNFDEKFTVNGTFYNFSVYDGRFYGSNGDKFVFMDSEGKEITSFDIDHQVVDNLHIG